ncbi:ABC transporter substrate-binding protein [Alcaligenes endophyticus]
MKLIRSVHSLAAALACAGLMGTTVGVQAQTVSVSSIVEHPALDSIKDGVHKALSDAGYTDKKDFKWQFQTAQGNPAIAAQIARKFVGDDSDVIVAISTPSAQSAVAATKNIPIVYSAVTDPVAAHLVPSLDPSGTNVTGVSDALALEAQVELIKKVVPHAKKVGMVYNPGEANSAVVVAEMKKLLNQQGMELVEATAARTVDVGAAARSLVGKVDVIYTNTDNNVVSAYEALVKVGMDAKIPLVASDTDSVGRGAIAALGVNYYDLGVQTGKMVIRILNGEKPGDIASETSSELELFVNPKAAKQQGVELSEEFIKSAQKVVE